MNAVVVPKVEVPFKMQIPAHTFYFSIHPSLIQAYSLHLDGHIDNIDNKIVILTISPKVTVYLQNVVLFSINCQKII